MPFGASSRFDRSFAQVIDDGPGFYDGKFDLVNRINGAAFPRTPTFMVAEGDLVKVKLVNRGHDVHPMHPHGHHALVLRRNGSLVAGSPWWIDTLDVEPGETYEIAFRADNPGM